MSSVYDKIKEFGKIVKKWYIWFARFEIFAIDKYVVDYEKLFLEMQLYEKAIECCVLNEFLKNKKMAIVHIHINQNQPPSNIDDSDVYVDNGATYTFTEADFTNGYSDPEGDPAYKVKLMAAPANGTVLYNGSAVTSYPFEVTIADIQAGKLQYQDNSGISSAHVEDLQFEISDTGSQQYIS